MAVDAGQVEVTRRLERESGSEYRVNGSSCRLLDVQDLVGGAGHRPGDAQRHQPGQGGSAAQLHARRPAGRWWRRRRGWAGSRSGESGPRPSWRRPGRTWCAWPTSSGRSRAPCGPCASRPRRPAGSRRPRRSGLWPRARILLAQVVACGRRRAADRGRAAGLGAGPGRHRGASSPDCAGSGPARRTGSPSALQEREQVGRRVSPAGGGGRAGAGQGDVAAAAGGPHRGATWTGRAGGGRAARADVESLGRRLAEVTARTADESRLERVGGWSAVPACGAGGGHGRVPRSRSR